MQNLIKIIQIALTLFYGQLLAVAVYDLIIQGSSELNQSYSSYSVGRVVIGAVMLFCSVLSIPQVWKKNFRLLYVSGALLISILVAYVVLYTLYFRNSFNSTASEIANVLKFSIKAALLLMGSFVSFFLASRGSYYSVEN